jgi:fructose/tagatose bisphosphate aldolase
MLALLSTELARAKRHKKPIISCKTVSLQIAAAAVQAAMLEREPVLITIDATDVTTLPHQALLTAVLEIGRSAPIPVMVEVIVGTAKGAASWWLSNGVLALTLTGTQDAIKRNLASIAAEAFAHGAEIGIEPTDLTLASQAKALAQRHDATFIRLQPREKITEMHELVTALEVPVIADALHLTPKKTKELIRAGCAGLTLATDLDEAYTAGIRTALRDRTMTNPAKYLSYGATAVRELVRAHYHYFSNSSSHA